MKTLARGACALGAAAVLTALACGIAPAETDPRPGPQQQVTQQQVTKQQVTQQQSPAQSVAPQAELVTPQAAVGRPDAGWLAAGGVGVLVVGAAGAASFALRGHRATAE